jgi:hypothetical protein
MNKELVIQVSIYMYDKCFVCPKLNIPQSYPVTKHTSALSCYCCLQSQSKGKLRMLSGLSLEHMVLGSKHIFPRVVYGIKQIADGKKGDLAEYSSAIGEFRPF